MANWVPLRNHEIEAEINRVNEVHQYKNIKNQMMQQDLANRRTLSKMTSALKVRESQDINMLRRVGPSRIKQRTIGAAFFHRNNLLQMPLRRRNVLNFPYVHKPIRPGQIRSKIFQGETKQKTINVINDPRRIKTSVTTLPNRKPTVKIFQHL